MARKKTILPPSENLDLDQLLQEAEDLDQACEADQREQRRQWLQPTFRSRWEQAVDDLTRDPSFELGRQATSGEVCAAWAKAWHRFRVLLIKKGLAAKALQLESNADEARAAAVELFHHAAQGATVEMFERWLAFIASRYDLFGFKKHIPELAHQIWPGDSPIRSNQADDSAAPTSRSQETPSEPQAEDMGVQPTWLQQAIGLVMANPDKPVRWYADRLGRSRQYLYKIPALRNLLKNRGQLKGRPGRGYRDEEGNIEVDDRPSWRRSLRNEDE
jgi:hypothetical protein